MNRIIKSIYIDMMGNHYGIMPGKLRNALDYLSVCSDMKKTSETIEFIKAHAIGADNERD